MKSKPYVWGTFVWNMFDFAVSTRHEGGVPGRNDKGLVTYDRKTKKDAFYFYKANWSDEPVLYIAERRFTERTNAVTDVKIYSNATDGGVVVERKIRRVSPNQHELRVCLEERRNLKPGENRITARAERDGKKLSDACKWTLQATTSEH